MKKKFILLTIFIISAMLYSNPNQNLFTAIMTGDIEKVRTALKNGADVNASDAHGRNPVILASTGRGHAGILKLLIKSGGDVNAKTKMGWTALMFAVYQAPIEITRILINSKADINAVGNNGETALKIAAQMQRLDIVNFLKSKGASE